MKCCPISCNKFIDIYQNVIKNEKDKNFTYSVNCFGVGPKAYSNNVSVSFAAHFLC